MVEGAPECSRQLRVFFLNCVKSSRPARPPHPRLRLSTLLRWLAQLESQATLLASHLCLQSRAHLQGWCGPSSTSVVQAARVSTAGLRTTTQHVPRAGRAALVRLEAPPHLTCLCSCQWRRWHSGEQYLITQQREHRRSATSSLLLPHAQLTTVIGCGQGQHRCRGTVGVKPGVAWCLYHSGNAHNETYGSMR